MRYRVQTFLKLSYFVYVVFMWNILICILPNRHFALKTVLEVWYKRILFNVCEFSPLLFARNPVCSRMYVLHVCVCECVHVVWFFFEVYKRRKKNPYNFFEGMSVETVSDRTNEIINWKTIYIHAHYYLYFTLPVNKIVVKTLITA